MAYDRADWHYGGDFPSDLPPENGGTHIGFFLAWAIHHHLEGDLHHEDEANEAALDSVRARTMTGREFLFKNCDQKFWNEDLNEEGNRFAAWYYESNEQGRPTYMDDYTHVFLKSCPKGGVYYLEDTWANYDKIAATIDRRFKDWKSGKPTRVGWLRKWLGR